MASYQSVLNQSPTSSLPPSPTKIHNPTNKISSSPPNKPMITTLNLQPPSPTQHNFIQESSHKFIKLHDKDDKIVDIIDGLNEDPFTIETFNELVKSHRKANKLFIIARVTTNDPHDEKKYYFSYYSAHHLNKVLFRTQPEESLLHRMKAKNPLNGLIIMGDVHYYAIQPEINEHEHGNDFIEGEIDHSMNIIHSAIDNLKHSIYDLFSSEKKPYKDNDIQMHSADRLNFMKSSPTPSNPNETTPLFHGFNEISNHSTHFNYFGTNTNNSFQIVPNDVPPSTQKTTRRNSFDDSFVIYNSIESTHPNPPSKIRSFSYKNQHQNGSVEFQDWVNDIKGDDMNADAISIQINSPRKRSLRSSKKKPVSPLSSYFYKAVFIGTDDDFLMISSTRSLFKQNALIPEDAMLFTLEIQAPIQSQPHPILHHFNIVEMQRFPSVWTHLYNFLSTRHAKLFVSWYCLVAVVTVVFFVSPNYRLMASFIFTILLWLFILIAL